MVGMSGYVCFYGSKRVEVRAENSYAAQQLVAAQLKVPRAKQYMISVVLAEKDGKQVTHSTAGIG